MNFVEVLNALNSALYDFKERDSQLLELTADERAATHRIAVYLEKYFPGWYVDCEYNRKNKNIKELPGIGIVRPDIIVHYRDTSSNLLVIEVKKGMRNAQNDRCKLIEFTKSDGGYRYRFGVLLLLSMKQPYGVKEEWYQDGKHIPEYDLYQNLDMRIP